MNEFISISYHRSAANVADLAGFKDVLSDTLSEQGSVPVITTSQLSAQEMHNGAAVRIVWTADYAFASPDAYYNFGEQNITVEVVADKLDHNALMKLLAGRGRKLSQSYRNALRGIYNVSVSLKNGDYVPTGMSTTEYLSVTLENAVNAFPNSN